MQFGFKRGGVLAFSLLLAACGGGNVAGTTPAPAQPGVPVADDPTARGTLAAAPSAVRALSPNETDAQLAINILPGVGKVGGALLSVFGGSRCGVEIHEIEYNTVGAAGEKTNATAALMLPAGADPVCQGKRPLLLYAHGTAFDRRYNIGDFTSTSYATTESAVAAIYAAAGYIVVAPNYAGYQKSRLAYHPFHNADQQSKDMLDALAAARKALPRLAVPREENGKLFVTGYSQGGFVAMATLRALQAAGTPPTATAASSGAYAMLAQIDAAYAGTPIFGGAGFGPMLETSWQKAYGTLYKTPADIYNTPYAASVEAVLPSETGTGDLVAQGKLAAFQFGVDAPNYPLADALHRQLFGPSGKGLLKSAYVGTLLADQAAHACNLKADAPLDCAPAAPLRQAALKNDLRTFVPSSPLLMCGANADPVVAFANTRQAYAYFIARGAPAERVLALEIDSDTAANDPFASSKKQYANLKAAIELDALLAGRDRETAVLEATHAALGALGCANAAYEYFKRF
jgi:hypothetical protein